MPCDYTDATLRLIAYWLDQVAQDNDYALRVTLADVVSRENIEYVSRNDMLRDYSEAVRLKRLAIINAELDRHQELTRAWLAPRRQGALSS